MGTEKWINWKTITGTIITVVVGAAATGSLNKVKAAYTDYQWVVASVHSHMSVEEQARAQRQETLLKQIASDIQELKKTSLTVIGLAKVGTDLNEPYIMVNASSKAAQYSKMERARITNLVSEEHQSLVLRIRGVFNSSDENYIILVSKRAADMLGMSPGVITKVRIEPTGKGFTKEKEE